MTITLKRVALLSLTLMLFITSCEKEEFESETFPESAIVPISFAELEHNAQSPSERIESKSTSDTVVVTWAATDGYYFERIGDTIYGNPNTGEVEKYTIWNEGANFTYINNDSGVYYALPIWNQDTLTTSYVYSFDEGAWKEDEKLRYARQESDDDFVLYYSSVSYNAMRFGWYIGSSSTYADYRHDIYVDGEKIEENHTFRAARNYFHIYSLEEETEYDIKIVAKDQGDEAVLRIKNFTIKTAKEILISDFEFRVSNITQSSITLSWTIPDVLNSSSDVERFSLGFGSNTLGAFMGYTVGVDTEVVINFTFNEKGEITGIFSPETVGPNSSIPGYTNVFPNPIPKSTAFLMNVSAIVPSDNPEEPYYTATKRVTADDYIQLLDE